MRIFVQVQGGKVVNRIRTDDAGLPPEWPNRDEYINDAVAQIGWSYVKGQFIEPEPEPLPEVTAIPPDPRDERIRLLEERLEALEAKLG